MNIRGLKIINEIIIHCSASPYEHHDDVSVIDEWHKIRFKPTPDGTYCGYHFYIKKDGTVQEGRQLKWYGQHCSGHNWKTIGICIGGMGGDTITNEQMKALEELIIKLKSDISTIKELNQHSTYAKHKPHCAGLSESQINYLKNLIYGISN